MEQKKIIYQVFPRLFGNVEENPVFNGSKQRNGVGKFADFTPKALEEIKCLGTTHVWYTGVVAHATKTDYTAFNIPKDHDAIVKGNAGSAYAIKDYYDVDPDLAENVNLRMEEFKDLVQRTHDAGLKVIIDFVPNHVARSYSSQANGLIFESLGAGDDNTKAFLPSNNFYYLPGQPLSLHFGAMQEDFEYSEFPAKATGNNRFDAYPSETDWYETVKLNYGVDYMNGGSCHFDPIPNTWHKMLAVLLFWTEKGVDGFRCDMAEMVPVEFWKWAIAQVKAKTSQPVLFIAEVYNPQLYRSYIFDGGFDYLYDKVGLYDTLRAVMCDQTFASEITKAWQAVEGIQPYMLNFLENHDEQRIASDFFAGDAQMGIPAMTVAALMNTNPVMLYSGQEFGESGMDKEGFSGCDGRTSIFDYWSVASVRNWVNNRAFDGEKLSEEQRSLREMYAKLLNDVCHEPVVSLGAFYDLMYANADNNDFSMRYQYAFLRKYANEVLLVVANFDRMEQNVRLKIPAEVFQALGFKDNEAAEVKDFFTGEEYISTLTTACPYALTIPACSIKVLKFKY